MNLTIGIRFIRYSIVVLAFCVVFWVHVGSAQDSRDFGSRDFDSRDFDSIRSFLDDSVKNGTVAGGSLLIFQEGQVAFQTGFGFADIQSKRPFEIQTPAIVASISKPMLGTTLFRLSETSQFKLTAPITDFLPEFKNRKLKSGELLVRPPSLIELLTHSSGLRSDNAKLGRIWFQDWTRDQKLEDVVRKVARDFPFASQPGTKFAYSGIGTDVAARIGEKVSGLSRNEMLLVHFCRPLGMNDTFYRDSTGLEEHGAEMPTHYYRKKETGKLLKAKDRPLAKEDRYSSSGGTVISTAPDLLKWLLMLRNRGMHQSRPYLSQSTIASMLKEQTKGKISAGGLFVRNRDEIGLPARYGHTGSSGTNVWIDFETDTIGIMLTQTRGSDIKPFRLELERRVMDVIHSR